MIITQLEVIDFKKIEVVNIDPVTGQPIILTGDNAQGKSSILDAMQMALVNKGTNHPIRKGADKATVTLTMGGDEQEFIVKRSVTAKGSYLNITDKEGKSVPQAQKFLSALIGNLAFDPEEFARMKPKDQANALKLAAGVDTDAIDAEYKEKFAERTVINRQKEAAEKLYKAADRPSLTIGERISITEQLEEKEQLKKELSAQTFAEQDVIEGMKNIEAMDCEIDSLEKRLATLRADRKSAAEGAQVAKERLDEIREKTTDHKDLIAAIDEKIAGAEEHNQQITNSERVAQAYQRLKADYEAKVRTSGKLSAGLDQLKVKKDTMILNSKLPVEGLAFDHEGVFFNEIAFEDLNTAKKIEISTLVAMAQNPELRIIVIREGALINAKNLSMITQIASEKGYQVWVEKFQETAGNQGLHIVEGAVSHIDGEPQLALT